MMSHRKLLIRTAVAAALASQYSLTAFAQTAATPPAEQMKLEEVIVTGTNIRGAAAVGSEPIVLSSVDVERTGLASTADVLRQLPQNQTRVGNDVSFQGGTANQGYNGAQVDSINLRGLGSSATLILVDGRRVVGGGGASTITDANQVPIGALERLEVLVDGASAVYGSDAVAGVVNFVVRQDFEGVEVNLRADDNSGGDQYGGTIIAGNVWNSLGGLGKGNVLFTYDRRERDAFGAGEIARLRADLRPLGGPDLRIDEDDATVGLSPNVIVQGNAANTSITRAQNYTYYGVPYGDGTGLTSASLALNQPNLVDGSDYTDWTGEQTRDQIAVYFNQELTQSLELFGSLNYTDRETTSRSFAPTVRVPMVRVVNGVPQLAPYFIPGLPANQTVQYSTLKDGRSRTFSAAAETYGGVLGLRAQLPAGWDGEAFFNYGRAEQCDSCVTGSVNLSALTEQVFAGNINPLSSLPLTPEQANLVYGKSKFESRTTLEQGVVKLNGPLFDLPAGALRAAVGAEYRTETNANRNESLTGPTNTLTQLSTYGDTEYDRNVGSVFLELNAPVLDSLTLSAAVRYDDYSDFGDTTNPKLGVTWNVTDQIRLQGTWGTSFRAPSVTDSNPNAVTSGTGTPVPNYDPRITNGILPPGLVGPFGLANGAIMLGSNPDLSPEEAETWTITAGFSHEGLNVDLTYWDITYDDQIVFPGSIAYLGATPADVPANGGNYGGWAAYILPVNNPVTCSNADISSADPVLQQFLESVNYDFITNGGDYSAASALLTDFCKVNVIIDSRIQNVGSVHKTGLDFNSSYVHDIGSVTLVGRLAATYFLKNDISTGPGIAATSEIGDLADASSVFELSGTAGLTALWRGFDATLTARYLDGMLATSQLNANGLPGAPDRDLSSYTQFDLSLGYSAEFENRVAGLKGWRAQLVFLNVTDELPDFFVQDGDPTGAWNYKYGLPFGRTFSAQLTARF